jgi:hypothetical protein
MFPDSNARRSHHIARILHHPTFSFSWVKIELGRREYNGEDELYEVVDERLTGLIVKMIETVFVDWMNRLQCLTDGTGDCVS